MAARKATNESNETPEGTPTPEPAKRGRKPGEKAKPKTFGANVGIMLDTFESFDATTRKKMLDILNKQYGGEAG